MIAAWLLCAALAGDEQAACVEAAALLAADTVFVDEFEGDDVANDPPDCKPPPIICL